MASLPHGGSLLHVYSLHSNQTRRLLAAYVRLREEHIEALSGRGAQTPQPIVALFCTKSSREPVCLRTEETIFVSLPGSSEASWLPLRVMAHHAYVRGMRVSGTIHRAIVRLARA
jgi:hypothetical protein